MVRKLAAVVGRDAFENDAEGFPGISLPLKRFNLNAFFPVQMPVLSPFFAGFHLLCVDAPFPKFLFVLRKGPF